VNLGILAANVLGFPALQLAVAWTFVRLPGRAFRMRPIWRVSPAEAAVHRNLLRVRTWKHWLPQGGRWMGSSFDHSESLRQGKAGRARFLLEARRSEASHWTALLGTALFALWNPPWAIAVMFAAGVLFNLPCILVQRYNRAAIAGR
jgi:glycosyl-4,4'-diaponeurosporenoate acyltransferase